MLTSSDIDQMLKRQTDRYAILRQEALETRMARPMLKAQWARRQAALRTQAQRLSSWLQKYLLRKDGATSHADELGAFDAQTCQEVVTMITLMLTGFVLSAAVLAIAI